MKPPELQAKIVAHLKAAGGPVSSRDLAARFLLIRSSDEATCHRLLNPILAPVRGVTHAAGAGWSSVSGPITSPVEKPEERLRDGPTDQPEIGLRDFVALSADGAGPGGSGLPRVVAFLPVVGGEEMQEEFLPAAAAEDLDPDTPAPAAGLTAADLAELAEAVGDMPLVAHRVTREVEPLRRAAQQAGLPFHPQVISAARLGHLLLGLKANHAVADLAGALGVEVAGPDDCRGRARMVARSFLEMIPRLEEKGIATAEAVVEFQALPAAPLDLSRYDFTCDDLKSLPAGPGVYRFLDRQGEILYVGKAKNLRSRVGSYFVPSATGTAKGRAILESLHRFVIDPVGSELEAILLEAALLREHRPRLNRQFDVHERPAPYGPRLNLIVVLPDADTVPPVCTLHLLRNGAYLERRRGLAGEGSPAWEESRRAIALAYFDPAAASAPGGELDWALVSSFLGRHRDAINVLDIDECPTAAAAAERLRVLIDAVLSGAGRVLAR
jgi:hypothetical protein